MAKRRVSPRSEETQPQAVPAVVLPFPLRSGVAAAGATSLAPAPLAGERPTLLTPAMREWLRAALIVSVAVHVLLYLAFQLRFHDDLERAAGAAESLASQGTITIPVEIVVEAALPSAPTPTDASEADAKEPAPTQEANIDRLIPPVPEPAPVVLPTREAVQLALPTEDSAPARAAESAAVPEAPTATITQERKPAPPKPEQAKPVERQEKKTARSTPSMAASPSQTASANSSGNAGAGGAAETGGTAAISSYQAQVLAHLSRHRIYPPEARERGITGVARVQFALARDGRVLSASLIGGSGERTLDGAAVEMVRRASPFPPFPTGVAQARMDFAAPIRFDLR